MFCVGLVTEAGILEDHAYNQAAWEGLLQARASGAADWVEAIESQDARDYTAHLRTFAEAGYDAVISVGESTSSALYSTAREHAGVYFIGVDQSQPAEQSVLRNLTRLSFPEDQLGFLAGALAAWMSESGRIGAICGSDALPAMQRYGSGFLQGAAFSVPGISATVLYHNQVGPQDSTADPEWGAEMANALIDSGVDVIFGTGGLTGSNALVAAASRGVYGIGADNDQYFSLPVAAPRLLSSVIKDIPQSVAGLIQLARLAQAGTAIFPAGTTHGGIGLAPFHDLQAAVPDDVKVGLASTLRALSAGEIRIEENPANP